MTSERQLVDELFRQVDGRIGRQFELERIRVAFGPVDAVDTSTRKASVFLGSGASSSGFSYGEHEPQAGDLVAVLMTADGARMILRILGRDIVGSSGGSGAQASKDDAVAAAADYLTRIKLEADTEYRLRSGLDASDNPELLFGPGGTTAPDAALFRAGAKTLTIDDTAGGAATLNVIGSLKRNGIEVGGTPSGTSFPGSPASGDQFFRTDLRALFVFDGTRWVTATLFTAISSMQGALFPFSATNLNSPRGQLIVPSGFSDAWIERQLTVFFIAGGGTALSGSHKWDIDSYAIPSTDALPSVAISSGASVTWRKDDQAVGALWGAADFAFETDSTKTGTPGNLTFGMSLLYRLVAT